MSDIENTNAPSLVVTQADRDAAADLYIGQLGDDDGFAEKIRTGTNLPGCNAWEEAFARHRIAERERCARVADEHVITADDDVQAAYARAAIDIAEVIRRGQ